MSIRIEPIKAFAAIAYICGLVCHFSALLPTTVSFLFYGLSLFSGLLVMFEGIFFCSKKIRRFLLFWILICLYLLIVGMFNSGFYETGFSINIFLAQDLRFIAFIGVGIVLADARYSSFYFRFMNRMELISVIMGIIALFNYGFDISKASLGARLGIWDLPYYLWWAAASVFAFSYPFARLVSKKRSAKMIGYSAFALYFFLGLLFIKRSSLINSCLIVILTELIANDLKLKQRFHRINKALVLFLILTVMIIAMYLLPYTRAVIDAMFNRLQGNFFEYDRAVEASLYFSNVEIVKIIFGQGIGHYYRNLGNLDYVNALHVGLYNLIYKGGVVLLFVYFYFICHMFKNFANKDKLCSIQSVALITSISYFFSLFYEASWSYTIYMIQYVTPIVIMILGTYCIDYECVAERKD